MVVAEHFHKRALPETIGALTRTREKRVGDHVLSFYRRASGADRTVGADEEARGADVQADGRADGKSGGRAHDGAEGRAGGRSERGQGEEEAS